MKYILLLPLLISIYSSAQDTSISYTNYPAKKANNPFGELNTLDAKINEITLHPDGSFEMWSRPHISCFTWHEYKGLWTKNSDTITFNNEFEIEENDIRVSFDNNKDNNFYSLSFSNDNHSELKNRNIKISFVYDFDSDKRDVDSEMTFDLNNSLKIPFKNIPDKDKLAAIRIEYFLSASEKRFTYLTENNTVNKKYSDVPNIIDVEFITKPKKEIIYRTVKAIQKQDNLQVIYSGQTIPSLPDYSQKLNFESVYTLDKNQ